MLINIEKLISEQIDKMKPEQIGGVLISALKSFNKLPVRQQEEIKTMLKDIMR